MKKRNETPRRVDFQNNLSDQSVLIWADAGLHAHAIADKLNLTISKVSYRYRKAGLKLKDYRNGTSVTARWFSAQVAHNPKLCREILAGIKVLES